MDESKTLWEKLKTLVNCDKELREALETTQQTTDDISRFRLQIIQLQTLVEEKKQEWKDQEKKVNRQEIYAQDLKKHVEAKTEKLEHANSEKEYAGFTKELKTLERSRIEQENVLMSSWNDLEKAEIEFNKIEKENTQKIEELNTQIQNKNLTIENLKNSHKELEEKRTHIITVIPTEWLVKYERMRHSVLDPIVPVHKGSCSSCYYSVLQQDLFRLRKSGILPCRNCYRLLYYDHEEEQETQKATF
jgi:predicted  nucleic acid-binding Zn-ribbon protein